MNIKQKQILINMVSYEKLISENMTQIAELEKHLKDLKKMNKIFVNKMIELNSSYSKTN